MSKALEAGFWGALSGSALILGALAGYFFNIPRRIIGAIMAFGAGVLISALSFDLMDEAFKGGGILPAAIGFLGGSVVYSIANYLVNQSGAKHRKRSGTQQLEQKEKGGDNNGMSIALGALLDGIPESIVIGVSLLAGKGVSMVAVIAIFLSNIPEGLSSSAGMKTAGKSKAYIFGIWTAIALISGIASLAGYLIFGHYSPAVTAATTAVAAGAILSMIANTMMPKLLRKSATSPALLPYWASWRPFALPSWPDNLFLKKPTLCSARPTSFFTIACRYARSATRMSCMYWRPPSCAGSAA